MRKLITIIIATLALLAHAKVKPGIEVLLEDNFCDLINKNVGLICNPTAVNSNLESTIDILHNSDKVNLVALFAPEHGVRGDVPAGAKVASYVDQLTGINVYSLYGATKTPTAQMLSGIDVMVYDMQDIGCRSYTFISTLGRVMKACVANNVEFLVLDRPNPLGGNRIEGPMHVEPDCKSFVSEFDIPYVYGLTPGELALYLNATLYDNKCNLKIIKMQGWDRSMVFSDTELPWVPTSPNIPTAQTALYYPSTGILGELGICSIGANFTLPFQIVVSANINAVKLSQFLNSCSLQGVSFRPYYVKIAGEQMQGVQVYITDAKSAHLTSIQFYIMEALAAQGINPLSLATQSRKSMFDKVCGTKSISNALINSVKASSVLPMLTNGIDEWREQIKPYLLYK